MKKSNGKNNIDLNIPKPTEEEIKQTKKLVKDKYGIVVPKSDVIKLVNLIKELDWWVKSDKSDSSKQVTEKMTLKLQELMKKNHRKDITLAEASNGVCGLLVLVPLKEKQRISDEIRAILVTHREILRDPIVTEKTARLICLQYDLELTNNQLDQIVQFLSKTIWFEEALDESLEKCLDDLLVYADKCKRGKRVNGLESHDKVRHALDKAVKNLKLTDK